MYNTTMKKKCEICKESFSKKPSDSKKYWAIKRFCSQRCFGVHHRNHKVTEEHKEKLRSLSGSNSHAWKGGIIMGSQGYMLQYNPVTKKHMLQHRYVIEQHLGRKLEKNEHVHHLNGDRLDNRIENLVLMDRTEHGLIHANQRWHGASVCL